MALRPTSSNELNGGRFASGWKRELQIFDDIGAQRSARPDRIRFEAISKLFGDDRAADDGAPLEDQHLFAGLGKICRGDEPVVSRADDDGVVGISHVCYLMNS